MGSCEFGNKHQGAKFEIAFSRHFGKVVFPNKKIFMILPRCLMPKRRIAISSPVSWQTYARGFRKHSRKLGRDLAVESLAGLVRRNLDVVPRSRKLKLVYRRRTQGGRQLDGVPIRIV